MNINLLRENNLEYIEIDVPAYPIAISCKGNYYYRSGSTNQKLTGIELESFILRKRGATWDNVPHPLVKIEDLDQNAIQKFKELAIRKKRIDVTVLEEDTEVLLDKLHLINHGYLTNAALLLFSKDPERYFTGAFIKVGFFETDADLLYQDEVRGSLFEQIDKVIELIFFKYMKAKISYDGLQRIEEYFVTEASMREAILNAMFISNMNQEFQYKLVSIKINCILEMLENYQIIGQKKIFIKSTDRDLITQMLHMFFI